MKSLWVVWRTLILYACVWVNTGQGEPACDSKIYCDGPLLHTVQMAGLYPDSKTFVDKSLKEDPDVILQAFGNLTSNGTPSKDELRAFVDTYFSGPGEEFEPWVPTDSTDNPSFLFNVKDDKLRSFGKALCQKWTKLGRKIKTDVRDNPDRYSLLYLPNPFIVPGGRFREVYYWDSYWVIKGLLTCEMTQTVKGMLENFIHMVKSFGMVPNGNRKYYTRRSQPPFLIPMVDLYVRATNDTQFLRDNIAYLRLEHQFWRLHRSVTIHGNLKLSRYAASLSTPRPESHREDFMTTQNLTTGDKEKLFAHLASTCESGWDFSSRWMPHDNTTTEYPLTDTMTRDIVPVDLNSILCWNERLLARFYRILGKPSQATTFDTDFQRRRSAIERVFWDEHYGAWFDYPMTPPKVKWQMFYLSNVFPLFTGCAKNSPGVDVETAILSYLKAEDVLDYPGGVPTSTQNSSQQWDYPNAWPPLQHVLITALADSESRENQHVALQLAQTWVNNSWVGWNRTHQMFEKYDVNKTGHRGGGGEYEEQDGFGWTNGVVLDLLSRFGRDLTTATTVTVKRDTSSASKLSPSLVAVIYTISIVYAFVVN